MSERGIRSRNRNRRDWDDSRLSTSRRGRSRQDYDNPPMRESRRWSTRASYPYETVSEETDTPDNPNL